MTSLMDQPPIKNPALSNITIKMRRILGTYESIVAYKLLEG